MTNLFRQAQAITRLGGHVKWMICLPGSFFTRILVSRLKCMLNTLLWSIQEKLLAKFSSLFNLQV